jgi:CheY-like chemotaxis protein
MSKDKPSTACESCLKYEQIFQAIPSLLYVIDKDEQLIEGSEQLLHLLGIEQVEQGTGSFYQQLAQKSHWLEARIHSLRETDLEVMAAGSEQYDAIEPPITDNRGFVFYYQATRLPLRDKQNKVVGLIVNLVDNTARKMLEGQVKEKTGQQAPEKAKNRPYPPSIHRDLTKPPKFLVIEDNLLAQEATSGILQELDCQVDFASSIEDLDHLFKPGKFDVILMDIGLEGTSGYLMAKRIRQIEGDKGYCVPIIALTGFDADLVKTDCDYYFMEGAITKPLSMEQARQIIQCYIYDAPVSIRGLKSLKYKN